MKLNLALLKQLSEVAGIPGWEDRVRDLVIKELKGLVSISILTLRDTDVQSVHEVERVK